MKKDRNCSNNMYPIYPTMPNMVGTYQTGGINPYPPVMPMNMGMPNVGMPSSSCPNSSNLENQINNLNNEINNLERRISALEQAIGSTNQSFTKYNTSNYQMM